MGGAEPGLAFQEALRGMQQEGQQPAAGLGQIQRPPQSPVCCVLITECAPADRLNQERLNQPGQPHIGRRAIQDRAERGGRRARVVTGEQQRGRGDAHIPAFALWFFHAGQGLLGALRAAEAHGGEHLQCPRPRDDHMRCVQPLSHPLGGPEGGQRVPVPAACQLQIPGAAERACTSAEPGVVRRSAPATESQKCCGSRSSRPTATHPVLSRRPASLIQDCSSTVLPLPAGADTTITRAGPASRPHSPGRAGSGASSRANGANHPIHATPVHLARPEA